jgi:hypothetical protein
MFKTNDTKDRVNYGDLLLPPDGYVLNFAIGTTYSLDLESLTAVCLALGLAEETGGALLQNPVSMLNAIQKVSEKLLIFCEAGQIKMPGKPSALSLLLEKMIVPVALPKARGINHYPAFHPKTWVLQYVNAQGDYHYRFAVLSRNLTFDRSWDISFAMDSSKTAKTPEKTKPIINYLDFLRNQIRSERVRDARTKRSAIRKLQDALDGVSFTTDTKEFGDDFEIMPLGIGAGGYNMNKDPLFCQTQWMADYSFHELVVFSPFISGSLIEYWNNEKHSLTDTTRTLITRKSELSKITSTQSSRFQIYTLKDDIVDGEESVSDESAEKQKQDIHAKIYLRRKYSDVDLYLGSMNATYSAVNKNVEMMIRLRTKNRYYNGAQFLWDLFCGAPDNKQNPFRLTGVTEAKEDPQQETAAQLEQIIKAVCRLPMKASVTEQDGKYDISVEIGGQIPEGNISITPFRRNVPLPMENTMCFRQLDILQVSEFYMVRVATEDLTVDRIIMIPTTGIPEDRENAVVNSVVKDQRTFVEYVAFVLGDSYLLSVMEERSLANGGSWGGGKDSLPALYEKMLKTALEEPERIGEIGYLLQMITKDDIIPEEFRELYATFKKTLRLK